MQHSHLYALSFRFSHVFLSFPLFVLCFHKLCAFGMSREHLAVEEVEAVAQRRRLVITQLLNDVQVGSTQLQHVLQVIAETLCELDVVFNNSLLQLSFSLPQVRKNVRMLSLSFSFPLCLFGQ